jgi:hypothetical protein
MREPVGDEEEPHPTALDEPEEEDVHAGEAMDLDEPSPVPTTETPIQW